MIATSSDSRDSWDGASWLKEASDSAAGSTTTRRQLTRDLPAFPIHKVKIVVESGSFSSLGDGGFEFSNFSGRLVWVREDGQEQEGEDAQVGSHNGNLAIAAGKKAAAHERDGKNDGDNEGNDDDYDDDDDDASWLTERGAAGVTTTVASDAISKRVNAKRKSRSPARGASLASGTSSSGTVSPRSEAGGGRSKRLRLSSGSAKAAAGLAAGGGQGASISASLVVPQSSATLPSARGAFGACALHADGSRVFAWGGRGAEGAGMLLSRGNGGGDEAPEWQGESTAAELGESRAWPGIARGSGSLVLVFGGEKEEEKEKEGEGKGKGSESQSLSGPAGTWRDPSTTTLASPLSSLCAGLQAYDSEFDLFYTPSTSGIEPQARTGHACASCAKSGPAASLKSAVVIGDGGSDSGKGDEVEVSPLFVIFGGISASGSKSGPRWLRDVHVLDAATFRWHNVGVSGFGPSARCCCSMLAFGRAGDE